MSRWAPISRRRFLVQGAAVGAAVSAPFIWRRASAAETITVRDPGGTYVDAFREAFYAPFEAKTGVKVIPAAASHEPTAQIKGMVDTKTYTWDAALLSLAAHNLLIADNYLEPLQIEGSAINDLPPEYRRPHFAGVDVYCAVLAYRTDKVKNAPESWKDFWNVKDFPGRRALRAYPFDTIEEALMADGVPNGSVYPCDFNRAYASLGRIKPHISIWWKQGAQSSQLLHDAEVDMMAIWNGAAQRAIDAGTPARLVWNQNIAGVEGWCILKGTPRAARVREFIAFTMLPEQQAILSKYMTYGPTNPKAYNFIDKARAAQLSTNPEYRKTALMIDNDFWAKNKDQAVDKFTAWMI